jgi:hypothetical protein
MVALIGAPVLWLSAWTIMRLDGHNGPGLSWTAAHVMWLFAYPLFGLLAIAAMRQICSVSGTKHFSGVVAVSLTIAGAVAFVGQMIIDLAVGLKAENWDEMTGLYDDVFAVPGVEPGLFQFGPALLYTGLVALTVSAAASGRVPAMVPITVAVGTALMVSGREGPDAIQPLEGIGMVVLWLGVASIWNACKD